MALAGTISYTTTVYLTAAGNSNGDASAIATALNGTKIAAVDPTATVTATASGSAVQIQWPTSSVRLGDQLVADTVTGMIAGMSSLTGPVTAITCRTEAKIV